MKARMWEFTGNSPAMKNIRWRLRNRWWRNPLNTIAIYSPMWLCKIISKLTAAPKIKQDKQSCR